MKAMDTRLRARRAPFGLPAEGALGSGQEPTPEQSERHYRNCHQEDYLTAEQPDVAAVIEEVQLKCFNAKTETSSAADPATDFRPFANSPRSLANNFRIDTFRAGRHSRRRDSHLALDFGVRLRADCNRNECQKPPFCHKRSDSMEVSELIALYNRAWSEPDYALRQKLLEQIWAEDGTYTAHVAGTNALVDHIGA